jgi:hypothetical protein
MIQPNGNPVKGRFGQPEGRSMNIALNASTLSLARDALIAVRDGHGARIRCLSGHLWITEDRSEHDTIIGPNETFTISNPGLTLVMAIEPASLQLSEPRASLSRRLAAWAMHVFSPKPSTAALEC